MKLKIDWSSGEGEVEFSSRFLNKSSLFRMDVIQDWISQLDFEYQKAQREFCEYYDSATPNEQ